MAWNSALAQRLDSSIAIGRSATLWSEKLQEERRVFVALPASYDGSALRYPVLYVLDGDMHFQHVAGLVQFMARTGLTPEMIVIGVANSHRMRDFTTAVPDVSYLRSRGIKVDVTETGGADAFLSFCSSELVPWIESQYRTAPLRIVVGHSLSGSWSVYALSTHPELFQAHIAISPSLWWKDGEIEKLAEKALSRPTGWHFLRISWADGEPDITGPSEALAAYLEHGAPVGLQWQAHHYAGYRHETSPHLAVYDGLLALFSDWDDVLAHSPTTQHDATEAYARLSKKYGYGIEMSEDSALDLAGHLWDQGQRDAALTLYQHNLINYPRSVRTYARLGERFKALQRLPEALDAYRHALHLQADKERYPGPNDLQRSIDELQAQMSANGSSKRP